MAHDPTGYTDIQSISRELVSAEIQAVLKEEAQLLPTVMDYTGQVAPGADSVRLARLAELSAADKTQGNDSEAQVMTVSSDVLNLDKHKQILVEIEDKARIQSAVNLEAEVIKEQAREMALQIDKDIFFALKSVTSSGTDHLLDYSSSSDNVIALADIVKARELLRKQKFQFRDDNYFMLISPEKEREMLSINNFIKSNEYGLPGNSPLIAGEIGRVFGFRVLVSTICADDDAVFYHKSHVGFAMQSAAKFERDRNLRNLSDQLAVSSLYGVKVLRDGIGGVYYNGTGS